MAEQPTSSHEVTRLLRELSGGDGTAVERLFPLIYDELRAIAGREMRGERPEHTLQPTALVHEAFLRLVGSPDLSWRSRSHFINIAAQAMRRILVDHARSSRADKRGGGAVRVTLDDDLAIVESRVADALDIDKALEGLAALDARKARVVELRVFGGLSVQEVARALDVSEPTVKRDWQFAQAWMQKALPEGDS